jgi:ABC-type Mn2+/Zn2+ transport system ATPase subunit
MLMSVRVIYTGQDSKKRRALQESETDVIILLFDRWDDFTYKTTFPTACKLKAENVEIGGVQILIENEATSYAYLDNLIANGWDGVLPIPGTNYISTPGSLSFYEQIEGRLGIEEAISVARKLRDASLLSKVEEDADALRLVGTEGFRKSLQRERGSVKAFLDGWKLFGKKTIAIGNQSFRFRSAQGELSALDLVFSSPSPMPHDINVLIGPNGVGKSQLLHQIVHDWLNADPDHEESVGFADRPNLNQIVVVSYSPFELFPVDTSEDKNRRDHDVYRYFGLRGRMKLLTDSKRGSNKVTLSREFPKANAAQSLLSCLADDQKYGAIKEWSNKLQTMERVLGRAFQFDRAAIVVDSEVDDSQFFTDIEWVTQPFVDGESSDEEVDSAQVRYVPIASDRIADLKVDALRRHMHDRSGVVFLKDGQPIHLSSGQRLFSYIVINILGAVRRNSLILVDEPELFLHPSLEIAFVRMLKTILSNYGSKALVATHSLVTVREIPRDCVHVFESTADGIVVKTPPFETFGGDMQRISSYVFGDKALVKPYEEWVKAQLKELGGAEQLIAALGDDVNEEMLIQIHAMGKDLW